ncbi:hypothetical protein ACIQPR_05225 [Streptomyces sp. NPDC091280]|uniref:hypothetical protein n=1 Tax=Streptomyces sp. NPDC091280 TaxID=3365984 RepID=UPI0037F35971
MTNFDNNPPTSGADGAWGTVELDVDDPGKLAWLTVEKVGRWEGAGTPSRDQCTEVIGTNPLSAEEVSGVRYRKGDAFCFDTFGGGVVVFIRVLEIGDRSIKVDAISWDTGG